MKKLTSVFLAVLMSFYGVVAMTPATALADDHGDGHGNGHENKGRQNENHGSVVREVAKDNHGHGDKNVGDENENRDDNENENENDHHATSTPPTATTTPDTTGPNILFAIDLGLRASTTNLIWVTNEPSDSKIWFGTSTPVATTTAPMVSSGTLSYFHNLSLPGLATSTLYYYTISSTDASNNTSYYSNSFTTPTI